MVEGACDSHLRVCQMKCILALVEKPEILGTSRR
jgi:hypothetical protein